ncbi:HbrB-like-domain-containing protein, partial [Gautieria morchelliformis]
MPIEELNSLVRKHISTVLLRSLSRAISSLEQDITGLLTRGMFTLNVRLSELDDNKLLPRLAEIWEFFWHSILPYVEGVFHPLQTDKPMQSLSSRTHKSNRPSSPTLPEDTLATSTQSIDVRLLALRSFRDSIIFPIFSRLHTLLSSPPKEDDMERSYRPKLQQMLLVLVSCAKHCHTLAAPLPSPSQGESAATHLLRAIRSPDTVVSTRPFSVARHPSFFSSAAPRDRRGRVSRKSGHYSTSNTKTPIEKWDQGSDDNDDETPRNAGFRGERDREKEFLESLRSPELDPEEDRPVGGPAGGWGLGRGQVHQGGEDDGEEEALEWDQAQDIVERMVGLH